MQSLVQCSSQNQITTTTTTMLMTVTVRNFSLTLH